MRDRKIKTTAYVLLAALLLGGCGEQPIELTEQEEQTIVDYAAHVVSKYNIKQQDGIVRLSKSEETTETADTEAVEQPDSTEQMPSEGGDATGTPENAASDNSVSLNDAVAIPGIDTQYTGAEFATVYQQNSSYMVEPDAGNKYLVLHFHLENAGTEAVACDMLSRKVSFRVTLNDSVEAVAQVTILLNDFGTYQGTIEAGSGTDTVLLFEVPESTPEDLSKISLEVVENTVHKTCNL